MSNERRDASRAKIVNQSSIVNRQLICLALFIAAPVFAASLEKALDRSVSFEMTDKPLLDAAGALADQHKINILIDPNLIKDKMPTVTVKAVGSTLSDIITQIAAQVGGAYAATDQAVFIYKRGTYPKRSPKLKPSQAAALKAAVADLTAKKADKADAAAKTIEAFGQSAVSPLTDALTGKIDAAAKMRVQALLDTLKARIFYEPDNVSTLLNSLTGKGALDSQGLCKVKEAADAVNQALGNEASVVIDEKLNDNLLAIKIDEMQDGNMIRWLARLSGGNMELDGKRIKIVKAAEAEAALESE